MKGSLETFGNIWLVFSSFEVDYSTHILICCTYFLTLSNHPLIVIRNFPPRSGWDRYHHAKQCHTAPPMINMNWHGDIGFPPHRGINSFFFGRVKSEISLTHLERRPSFVSYYERLRGPNTFFSQNVVLSGCFFFFSRAVSLQNRNDNDDLCAFQSMTDRSLYLTNQ